MLVGAGLANALIAQRLSQLPKPPRVLMLEGGNQPFGEHTWSFHTADVSSRDMAWLAPLIAHRWTAQKVRFRGFERSLSSGYASLTSASVAAAIEDNRQVQLVRGALVHAVEAGRVTLVDGHRISADCVVDARGFASDPALVLGFQKFVGLEVETTEPHGISVPVIMDATVDQLDGYRFVYLLPFSPTRILIEDTRYADGEALDQDALRHAILAYARAQGWSIASVIREEHGVLPISLAYDVEKFWANRPVDVPQAGMRAALFHPTTGYSLPEAVKIANLIAQHWPIGSAALAPLIREHARERAQQQGFYRLLNRMLFRAAVPSRRHLVLRRFYKLPQALIERFYAGQTSRGDITRILVGKPPVPVLRALGCLFESSLLNSRGKRRT